MKYNYAYLFQNAADYVPELHICVPVNKKKKPIYLSRLDNIYKIEFVINSPMFALICFVTFYTLS